VGGLSNHQEAGARNPTSDMAQARYKICMLVGRSALASPRRGEGIPRSWSTRKSSRPTSSVNNQEQETHDGEHRHEPDRPIGIFSTSTTPFQTTRKSPSMRDARRAAQTRQPRYLLTIHRQNKQHQTIVGYDRLTHAYRGMQDIQDLKEARDDLTRWKSQQRS